MPRGFRNASRDFKILRDGQMDSPHRLFRSECHRTRNCSRTKGASRRRSARVATATDKCTFRCALRHDRYCRSEFGSKMSCDAPSLGRLSRSFKEPSFSACTSSQWFSNRPSPEHSSRSGCLKEDLSASLRYASSGGSYGRQGVPVKMHTVPAGPVRHRSSVFAARAQLA